MSELKYRLYGFMHHTAKKILGRSNLSVGNILSSSSIKMGQIHQTQASYGIASFKAQRFHLV